MWCDLYPSSCLTEQEEEAWEGIPKLPPELKDSSGAVRRDKSAFLHFLHYLDSDCLTADKAVQPGANPEFYLEELKSRCETSKLNSNGL